MRRTLDRAGWAVAGALALLLVLALAKAIEAGPLDPPGPVGSTMKALADLPPSWHQTLPADDDADECLTTRFTCVMGKAAVLDNETGLVWQQAPGTSLVRWSPSLCVTNGTGGRKGWRLPTHDELLSLVVPTVGLPVGHPFTVTSGQYWTTALNPTDPQFIITHNPVTDVGSGASRGSATSARVWCVRGHGESADTMTNFPQVWRARQLDANDGAAPTLSSRFFDIGNTTVVQDRETGLTWVSAPDTATSNWVGAVNACNRFSLAFVSLGWRLPTLAELLSLYTFGGTGILPTGHPFTGISGVFWTISTDAANSANAYTVDTTQVETSTVLAKSATTARHWCVRGGGGE